MATEEWIRKAIGNGRLYEDLPPRVRTLLPQTEWNQKVKSYCHQRGLRWSDSLAKSSCGEQEYYEDLIRFSRNSLRLFPYHLADYVCQVLRITPFKYYCDLLFTVMKEERSYDYIPNFTAADIVRVVGIGRNEYIAIMNQCKAKKLLWRVNKAIAKDFLPQEPLDIRMEPWWLAHVVNLLDLSGIMTLLITAEEEFRTLTPAELRVCRSIVTANGRPVGELPQPVVSTLRKRGLVYLDVPIRPSDHVSIPPLEGFVSNKDADTTGEKGDPIEGLLYATFVASTERADVASLAEVLSVDLAKLQEAVSIACRLGFGTRLAESEVAADSHYASTTNPSAFVLDLEEEEAVNSGEAPKAEAVGRDGSGGAIAVVVDAEVTSYLMMGALSPGLKRHSVSLFEGGRVTGSHVIAEMIQELHLSVDAGKGFEGEMARLSGYSSALARALETVAAAGGNAPLELLRKESLTGLAPAAAARVLAHSYLAVCPIAPLPFPPLPLSPLRPGPVNYGATMEACTPWLQLATYAALRQGPPALVLPAGQRFWRLPPRLQGCSHALVWPWQPAAVRAEAVTSLQEGTFLLAHLNEALTRSALLVQPLQLASEGITTVDVPLPLAGALGSSLTGVTSEGQLVEVPCPTRLQGAVTELGLSHAPGYLRLLQGPAAVGRQQDNQQQSEGRPERPGTAAEAAADPFSGLADVAGPHSAAQPVEQQASEPISDAARSQHQAASQSCTWVPLQLALGLPLVPEKLNELVCRNALAVNFLDPDSRAAHRKGQAALQARLLAFISEFGACSNSVGGPEGEAPYSQVEQPLHNLLFDGSNIWEVELTEYVQGIGMLCFD